MARVIEDNPSWLLLACRPPAGERLMRRLRSEVRDMGGTAQVLRAEALAGGADVISRFNAARDSEYSQVIAACGDLAIDIKSRMIDGRCTLAELNQCDKELAFTGPEARTRRRSGREPSVSPPSAHER